MATGRYKLSSYVHVGDRVVFDNSGGLKKELPYMKIVGEVIHIDRDDVTIKTLLPGKEKASDVTVKYYLLK